MGKGSECDVPEFLAYNEFDQLFSKFTSREAGWGDDYDLYLMEHNMWPLLLDAMNELGKKIEYDAERNQLEDFDSLTWLGQYLVRNHPTRSLQRDKARAECFSAMQMYSSREQGRREFIRRRDQLYDVFIDYMEQNQKSELFPEEIVDFLRFVDQQWCLGGKLSSRFADIYYPEIKPSMNFVTLGQTQQGRKSISRKLGVEGKVLDFEETWNWLMQIVESPHGIFEKKVFVEGDRRRMVKAKEAERLKLQMEKEARAREVMEATRDLEKRYNNSVSAIRSDQYLIESFDAPDYTFPKSSGTGQHESPSLKNLRTLLRLWDEVGILRTIPQTDKKPDANSLYQGCPWSNVLKFFNSLRKPGESDVDIIQRLMTVKDFQRLIKTRNVNIVDISENLSVEATTSADSQQIQLDKNVGNVTSDTIGEIKDSGSQSNLISEEEQREVMITILDEILNETIQVSISVLDARLLKKMMQETEVFVHLDEKRQRVMGYCRKENGTGPVPGQNSNSDINLNNSSVNQGTVTGEPGRPVTGVDGQPQQQNLSQTNVFASQQSVQAQVFKF